MSFKKPCFAISCLNFSQSLSIDPYCLLAIFHSEGDPKLF